MRLQGLGLSAFSEGLYFLLGDERGMDSKVGCRHKFFLTRLDISRVVGARFRFWGASVYSIYLRFGAYRRRGYKLGSLGLRRCKAVYRHLVHVKACGFSAPLSGFCGCGISGLLGKLSAGVELRFLFFLAVVS